MHFPLNPKSNAQILRGLKASHDDNGLSLTAESRGFISKQDLIIIGGPAGTLEEPRGFGLSKGTPIALRLYAIYFSTRINSPVLAFTATLSLAS